MSRGTTHRTVRIEDELWDAAKAKADAEGKNLSDLIRAALRAYVEEPEQLHAYAAAGFTVCGLETGGPISRNDGYSGPAHRTTTRDHCVTCEECRALTRPDKT